MKKVPTTGQHGQQAAAKESKAAAAASSIACCARSRQKAESSRDRRGVPGSLRYLAALFSHGDGDSATSSIAQKAPRASTKRRGSRTTAFSIDLPYLCGGRLGPGRRRSLVREGRGAHPFPLRVHAAHGCCLCCSLGCLWRG